MTAIIRHLGSGEHFLADLDESGDCTRLSAALPVMDATDPDSGKVDWARFEDAELFAWDDADEMTNRSAWAADRIAIVYTF